MEERFDSEQKKLQTIDHNEPTPTTASDSEKSLGKSMLMKVALASVLVASLIISIANLMVTNQLRDQTDEMQAEYDRLKEENRRLQYFLNKEVDEDYIIEYARDVLGMYFPDEDVYYNDVNE